MKVGIITVYYSENAGSLLQALSLGKKISELGHEVYYVNTKNKYSSHSIKLLFGRIAKELMRFKVSNIKNAIGKYYSYKEEIKKFRTVSISDIDADCLDLIIVGSDTVWDIESQYFKESSEVFFPRAAHIPIVSYAASVGNTRREAIIANESAIEALRRMKKITVRDEYSQEVLTGIVDKGRIDVVADPTIMAGKDSFGEYIYDIDEGRFLLVYSFNDFRKEVSDEIRKYANKNNLRIISIGKKYDWADKNVISSLRAFITYYNFADCVVTNTFHGNVFSILFNKQFINIDYGKMKVDKLLSRYGLSSRTYKEPDGNVEKMFRETIDYTGVNELLKKDSTLAEETVRSFLANGESTYE